MDWQSFHAKFNKLFHIGYINYSDREKLGLYVETYTMYYNNLIIIIDFHIIHKIWEGAIYQYGSVETRFKYYTDYVLGV